MLLILVNKGRSRAVRQPARSIRRIAQDPTREIVVRIGVRNPGRVVAPAAERSRGPSGRRAGGLGDPGHRPTGRSPGLESRDPSGRKDPAEGHLDTAPAVARTVAVQPAGAGQWPEESGRFLERDAPWGTRGASPGRARSFPSRKAPPSGGALSDEADGVGLRLHERLEFVMIARH